jgi:Rhodopirellula transposase DDE domain
VLADNTAGSPTQVGLLWTHLRPFEIAAKLWQHYGHQVSHSWVKRMLLKHGYCRRKQTKCLATGTYAGRDIQFKVLFGLVALVSLRNPVVSIDTKKKELLGNLYRAGKLYCNQAQAVLDHDYSYLGAGKVIPHGIYDLRLNQGFISIGTSHETADFVGDNLEWWWFTYGMHAYPDAKYLLILCDSGGANAYRSLLFKQRLQDLAKQMGMKIIVSHYPPYCSKWNPIEHKLFAQVHRSLQGVVFTDYELVREIIAKTSTKQGLKVIARINDKQYQIGLKGNKEHIDTKRILRLPQNPDLNYTILP